MRARITVGRNFGCSFIGTTQRLASVDTNAVENCELRFYGKTSGSNNLRKLRGFGLSKQEVEQVQNLKVGEFLIHHGTDRHVEQIPLFIPRTEPTEYKKPTFWERLRGQTV